MDNVIDYFSRKSYKEIMNASYCNNNDLTNIHRVYLGCLKQQDSNAIRDLIVKLEFKKSQIDHLTEEWETLNIQYQEILQHCINYLELPRTININLKKDNITISEEGHSWVIYDWNSG